MKLEEKNRGKILNKRIPLLAHKIIEYKNIECWHGCWKHLYTAQGKRIGTISLESNLTVYIKIFLPLKANSFTYVFYPKGNNVNKGLSIYELFNKMILGQLSIYKEIDSDPLLVPCTKNS